MTDDRRGPELERVDLSALDPLAEETALEGLVRRLGLAAAPELARRRRGPGLDALLARWRIPIFATSGALGLVAIAILLSPVKSTASRDSAVAEALGVPTAVAAWVSTTERPTPDALLQVGED